MAIAGMDESARAAAETDSRASMERLSIELRDLILAQDPKELLGYLYAQRLMGRMFSSGGPHPDGTASGEAEGNATAGELIDDTQFLLEYVHAAWASSAQLPTGAFSEADCANMLELAKELKAVSMMHCIYSSAGTQDGAFGPQTRDVELRAKTTWIMLRGNRYQVLEEEFFSFVLAPHDAALQRVYGIGATAIAAGFQAMANSILVGHMAAIADLETQIDSAHSFAEERGLRMQEAAEAWKADQPESLKLASDAYDDLLRGGICNVTKHTSLPLPLLDDLSFELGEEVDFYAAGPYSGTPLRTHPARKKPLIKLGGEHFAVDPCFARDSGYRALLWNLLQREPSYRREFERLQKEMSEAALVTILGRQLSGAKVMHEVWYRDVQTGQWVENDLLVRLDDVLAIVEAKAGAAASIASPALDFARHVQSVQDLVLKAYAQCRRFLEYLDSADEVPLYSRISGAYVEVNRVRLSDYRVVLPIGLTVESFSPFSAMCKELPGVEPILGRFPFVSISIDDLLVLNRLLPTPSQFFHYLEVRQSVAGIKHVELFDEFDHLGAYVTRNRFDVDIRAQLAEGASLVVWDGMSCIVDSHFAEPDWATRPVPTQEFPTELAALLNANTQTKADGWLAVDSYLRDYGKEGRDELSAMLQQCRSSLNTRESRYFQFIDTVPLFVWLQRDGSSIDRSNVAAKAMAAAISSESSRAMVILATASSTGTYARVERLFVDVPLERTAENDAIFIEAERLKANHRPIAEMVGAISNVPPRRLPGRNDPCWCGSGTKFKKCHGAAP